MARSLLHRLDADIREMLRGASVAALHRIAGMGFGFLLSVLLARLLGVTGLGIFTLAATTTTVTAIFGRAGIDMAMLRFASVGAHKNDWQMVRAVYRTGMRLAIVTSAGATALLFLCAPLLAKALFNEPDSLVPIRIMTMTVLPTTLTILHGEMLKAIKRTGLANFVQASAPPAVNLFVICAVYVALRSGLSPLETAWVAACSSIIVSTLSLWMWQRYSPPLEHQEGTFELHRMIATSLPLFWVASIGMIISVTDIVMLGIWMTADQIALYSVAARLAGLVSFCLVAVNTIAVPKLSAYYAVEDTHKLELIAQSATLLTGTVALFVAAIFWVVPYRVLQLFGPEFRAAAAPLAILSLGHLVHAATGPAGMLLVASGREKLLRNNMASLAIMNVILNALLIPYYGIVGAAAASAISLGTLKIGTVLIAYRELGLLILRFPTSRNRA